jgi:NAD(P)-dependent dehydrogenase (short-subunit alcohol dehydrogenase family)
MNRAAGSEAPRAALITGASSGIGFAVAELLAEDGWGLTLTARRPEKLAAAADSLRERGFEVEDVPGLIGEEAVVAEIVARHRDRFGRCDFLMNNAGMGVAEPIAKLTASKIEAQLATNLRGPAFLYRECLEMLERSAEEHGQALVVNVSSMTARLGEAGLSVYAAAKAALISFSESMHLELSRRGIKSTVLSPGFVDTPMADPLKGKLTADQMIQPRDLALTVRYLLGLSPATVIPELLFIRTKASGSA